MAAINADRPSGAFDGIRVLDVAEPIGAYVSRILGDLGADVIKIEPPGGDPGRHLSPFYTVGQEQVSLPFVHANLNKQSMILNLEQREDQERFRALAEQADVVVSTENAETWAARGVDLRRRRRRDPRRPRRERSPRRHRARRHRDRSRDRRPEHQPPEFIVGELHPGPGGIRLRFRRPGSARRAPPPLRRSGDRPRGCRSLHRRRAVPHPSPSNAPPAPPRSSRQREVATR